MHLNFSQNANLAGNVLHLWSFLLPPFFQAPRISNKPLDFETADLVPVGSPSGWHHKFAAFIPKLLHFVECNVTGSKWIKYVGGFNELFAFLVASFRSNSSSLGTSAQRKCPVNNATRDVSYNSLVIYPFIIIDSFPTAYMGSLSRESGAEFRSGRLSKGFDTPSALLHSILAQSCFTHAMSCLYASYLIA